MYINISYIFGCDLLSYTLILLRFWICRLILLARERLFKKNYYFNLFILIIFIILFRLILTFISINLFIFYLFFEIRIIPTLFLIIGWGYQPERIEAGIYLIFYTLLVSLPIIIIIFYLYKKIGSLDFYFLTFSINYFLSYICVNMIFFVKFPIFIVHLWLPKAHVEAPIAGSMILAGVILKLGGYGILRLIPIFYILNMNLFFIVLNLFGAVVISLICMRQNDIKRLIAYSSVCHMGLVLRGCLTLNNWGLRGRLIFILAHGLRSSGLFCLSNIFYERTLRRRIYLNKGILNIIPNLSFWWFIFCILNIAAPPSMNLLGEIFLINSLIRVSNYFMLFIGIISFLRAVYSLFLYAYRQHGKFRINCYSYYLGFNREYLLIILHWIPLNILFLKIEYFSLWIYLSSLLKILVCGTKEIFCILNFDL